MPRRSVVNHGFEHLYQGCIQDFTVAPWSCTDRSRYGATCTCRRPTSTTRSRTTSPRGQTLGLPFDPTEYLSGEHSGLFLQSAAAASTTPTSAAALTQAGILHIGSDASRDDGARSGRQRDHDPAAPDGAVLQHRDEGRCSRRVQLAVHHTSKRRQWLLRGQPDDGDVHRAAGSGDGSRRTSFPRTPRST